MPVSASKLVTLAQLQAQAERVKQELAKYTLASELGSLAKKSEISEADLSAALKSVIDGKMDAADSMTTEAINSAIATAIAKSAHARFEKVEKVPSNDEAQDNVLYLVMNAATGYYDIYAKVGEEVVRLDDTTVDLSNYATIDQLNAVSGGIGGTAYAGTKEDLSASDDSVIAAYFKAHTDVAVKKGDVFVVTTTVGNSTYEKSAYFYNGKAWVAMTGNVDADKVILRENITLAGGYTQVGNLTKSQNGTANFATKGKSVMDALTEIFSKRLQPSITAQPSIGTFTLTGAGAVEAGTKVAAAAYSGATLNAGSYQYGPATGVTATNWKVERITNAATTQVTTADAASLTAGSDNNGGAGFIIGDAGGDNAVSSLKYLKQLAQKAKAESDAVATRVKALEDVGAQANVLETIKVNGVVQSIEDKAVDIKVPGYTVEKSEKSGDYAAVYRLMKDGVAVGAAINIPKDMVVKSGSVVTNPTGQPKGTYIKLVLANATNDTLYVDVGGLIEYVTSGSAAGDMVVITIDEQTHKVTASITDGAITKAKLETEVQTALNKAHEHANAAELDKIATGDKAKWDATSAKVEGIAEGATKVEAGTTEGNIKINGVETAVVTIATDAEVTEMLTEVFGATA